MGLVASWQLAYQYRVFASLGSIRNNRSLAFAIRSWIRCEPIMMLCC